MFGIAVSFFGFIPSTNLYSRMINTAIQLFDLHKLQMQQTCFRDFQMHGLSVDLAIRTNRYEQRVALLALTGNITRGQLLSEATLWMMWRSCRRLMSISDSIILVVHSSFFAEVTTGYVGIHFQAAEVCKRYVWHLNQIDIFRSGVMQAPIQLLPCVGCFRRGAARVASFLHRTPLLPLPLLLHTLQLYVIPWILQLEHGVSIVWMKQWRWIFFGEAWRVYRCAGFADWHRTCGYCAPL